MNKAESDRIHELCSLIAAEKDRLKFQALVEELNRILDAKDQRLKDNLPDIEMCSISTVSHVVTSRSKRTEGIEKPSSKGMFWHNVAMTTKTIPEYLEDERRKLTEAQLRADEEAARIQVSHHAHRRAANQPEIDAPRQPKAAVKTKTTAARKKTRVTGKAAMKPGKSGSK
jgi:hypothetical protein